MRELGRDRGDRRPRRHLRAPVVLDRHRRSRPAARCCSASRRRAPRSRPRCCSSTSSGRRSTTRSAEELLATDGLDFARHHLRDRAPLPPAPAERARGAILTEKALSGRSAWVRLFEEQTAAITVELADGDEPVSLEVALARLFDPDREVRRDTAERVTAALQPGLRTRAYAFNTLLADKMTDDRLRAYPHWLAARNLSNEASDESVQALIEAVRARYELPRRWYRLKAQLLGHRQARRLRPHGRGHAGQREGRLAGGQARSCSTPTRRSPASSARSSSASSTRRWIDGPVRPGKRGGAFCSYGVPSVHPYVMLNYTYLRRDVLTLAHELGHGVHAALGARQGVFHMATPLTLAETASVFGETLVFGRLLEASPTPESQALAAGGVDRGLDRDRLPPGGDEPLRAPRPHARGATRASCPWTASASCGPSRRRSCWATPSRSPRATAPGGPTCPTSSPRPATCTRTRTGSCSRWRSTAATRRRAPASRPTTSKLLRAGGSAVARGARADRRRRPRRPGLLGQGPGPRGAQARRGRGGRARRRPHLEALACTARMIVRATVASSSSETDSSTACASSMSRVPTITAGMPRAVNRRMSAPQGTPASGACAGLVARARACTVVTHGWSGSRLARARTRRPPR